MHNSKVSENGLQCTNWLLHKLQMEEQETETYNTHYAAITSYLQSGMYPPDADKKEKRGLRKRAKYFVLFGGKLQYVYRRSINK